MINNFEKRFSDGMRNATDKVVASRIKPLGAVAAGIGGSIWGGYEGYKLIHDLSPTATPTKAGEVMTHVAEVMASGTGSVVGLLVGVGAGVVVLASLPSRR